MGCSGSSAKEPKAAAKGSTTAAAPGKQDSGDAHGAEFTVVLDQIVSKVRSLGDRATEHYQTLQGQIMEIEEQSFRNAEDAFHENGVATSAFAGAEEPALKLHTLCKQPGDIAEQPPFLEVAAGDRLEIILRNADGWSFCRKSDGKPPGWLPAGGVAEIAEAIADHGSMESQDLLAVKVGELVEVVSRHYSGWSFCRRWKEPGKDHPPEEGVRLRNEGWVTDAYLDDRRSEAALATKWQRLILEALGRVVRTARDLEAVVVNVRAKDSGGDTSSEWMVQCLEYTAWLTTEMHNITEAVAQREVSEARHGIRATVLYDLDGHGAYQLKALEGTLVTILDANNAEWVWCCTSRSAGRQEGWVPNTAIELREGDQDPDFVSIKSLNSSSPRSLESAKCPACGGNVENGKSIFCKDCTAADMANLLDLPSWIKEGQLCRWWSTSNACFYDVRITKISEQKQIVEVVFVVSEASWKSLPFRHFKLPQSEWKLQPYEEKDVQLRSRLPQWVQNGQEASWWSMSQERPMPVRIFEVDYRRRLIHVRFDADHSSSKRVPFHEVQDNPDGCLLQPSADRHQWRTKAAAALGRSGTVMTQAAQFGATITGRFADAFDDDFEDTAGMSTQQMFRKTQTRQMGHLISNICEDVGDMLTPAAGSAPRAPFIPEHHGESGSDTSSTDTLQDLRNSQDELAGESTEVPSEVEVAKEDSVSQKAKQRQRSAKSKKAAPPPLTQDDAESTALSSPTKTEVAATGPSPASATSSPMLAESPHGLDDEAPHPEDEEEKRAQTSMVEDESQPVLAPEPEDASEEVTKPQMAHVPSEMLLEQQASEEEVEAAVTRKPTEPWAPMTRTVSKPDSPVGIDPKLQVEVAAPAAPQSGSEEAMQAPQSKRERRASSKKPRHGSKRSTDGGALSSLPPLGNPSRRQSQEEAAQLSPLPAIDGGNGRRRSREEALHLFDDPDDNDLLRDVEDMLTPRPVAPSPHRMNRSPSEELMAEIEADDETSATPSPAQRKSTHSKGHTGRGQGAALDESDGAHGMEVRKILVGHAEEDEGGFQFGDSFNNGSRRASRQMVAFQDGPEVQLDDSQRPSSRRASETDDLGFGFSTLVKDLLPKGKDHKEEEEDFSPGAKRAKELHARSAWGDAPASAVDGLLRNVAEADDDSPKAPSQNRQQPVLDDSPEAWAMEALRVLVPDTWDSEAEDCGPPDVDRLAREWPLVEEGLDNRSSSDARTLQDVLDAEVEKQVMAIEVKGEELRQRVEAGMRQAEARNDSMLLERYRGLAWGVADAAARARARRRHAKAAKVLMGSRKAAAEKDALRIAIVEGASVPIGGYPYLPHAEAFADLAVGDALCEVAMACRLAIKAVQVVTLRPTPEGKEMAACEGLVQNIGSDLTTCLHALRDRLEREKSEQPTHDPQLMVLANHEEGLTKEQRRDKAMFESQQDFDWECKLKAKVQEQESKEERFSRRVVDRVEKVLIRRFERHCSKVRKPCVESLKGLLAAIKEAEEKMEGVWEQFRVSAAEEASALEAERREIHKHTRALIGAAVVIRQEKEYIGKAYAEANARERQKMMKKALRRVRRLNADLKALEVDADLKEKQSMLLHSLRMLEARLQSECPGSEGEIQEGPLKVSEAQKEALEEADKAFEVQLAADIAEVHAVHNRKAQRSVAQLAQNATRSIAVEHANMLPAARQALDTASRKMCMAYYAAAILRPFAAASSKLAIEARRHAEVEAGPSDPAGFGPKPKLSLNALQQSAEVVQSVEDQLMQAWAAAPRAAQHRDDAWAKLLAEAEQKWSAFRDLYPGLAGSLEEAESNTPRGDGAVGGSHAAEILKKSLQIDDLDATEDGFTPPGGRRKSGSPASHRPGSNTDSPGSGAASSPGAIKGTRTRMMTGNLGNSKPKVVRTETTITQKSVWSRATKTAAGRPPSAAGSPPKGPPRSVTMMTGHNSVPNKAGKAAAGEAAGLLAQLDELTLNMDSALNRTATAFRAGRVGTPAGNKKRPPPNFHF
mmetsp:Transcript_74365/g.177174  ORF Transcript_74365/g.177174 Transcript_74365/m.177174 type:complete len:2003 (-) Transcript_74365:134-6142(-)